MAGGGDVGLVAAGDAEQPSCADPGSVMAVILYLLAASLLLGGTGLAVFLWALRTGQFEDMDGAANRVQYDDDPR
jgi:cbb3-type cytochrome oxidase maturation protein